MILAIVAFLVCATTTGGQTQNFGLRFAAPEDDYVFVPRSASLEPPNEITVEAWAKDLGGTEFYGKIVRKEGAFDHGYMLAWGRGSSDQNVRFMTHYSSGEAIDPAPSSTYTGAWHHFAGVFSYSENRLELLIDGHVVAGGPILMPLVHTADLYLGGAIYEPVKETFNGIIDEVRIWSIARTPAEIQSTMYMRLKGSEPGLVGYWPFDEGAGQVAHDATGNGNDGQLGPTPSPEVGDPEWVIVDGIIPVEPSTWGSIKATFR